MNRPRERSYAQRFPEEFAKAVAIAKEDGTISDWTFGQLQGLVAPPNAPDWANNKASHSG